MIVSLLAGCATTPATRGVPTAGQTTVPVSRDTGRDQSDEAPPPPERHEIGPWLDDHPAVKVAGIFLVVAGVVIVTFAILGVSVAILLTSWH